MNRRDAAYTRIAKRKVNGILLLDKPIGLSSNAALQRAKKIFRAAKAGHTGNLDVQASGLLPICFGEATKICGFLLGANKTYTSVFRLGVTTTTGDSEGEVVSEQAVGRLSTAQIDASLRQFVGEIWQIPPMYSALKHNGQRLYKLAQQGLQVDRPARQIAIYELQRMRFHGEELEVRVVCSKGTYIRTLAEDLGKALGCGAHVVSLRRLAVGPFEHGRAHSLKALADATQPSALDDLLLPIDSALQDYPAVTLSADASYYLRRGQAVQVPRAPTHGAVRLYAPAARFIGIGRILDDGRVAPQRLLLTAPGGETSI